MSEWREIAVEELAGPEPNSMATGPFGSNISSKFFVEEGVPVIRGSNLTESVGTRLNESKLVFVTDEKAEKLARSIARRGDLIFTCWGTIGQVGLIDERSQYGEYVISNKQMKLTPDPDKADSLFLYYLFSSPEVSGMIRNQAIGSSVPGFNLGQLKNIRVRVPPLPTQQHIAHILGTLDDKIELNRRMNRTLEAIARAIFKSWFIDFDPVIDNAILNGKQIPDEFAEHAEVRREILARSNGGEGMASDAMFGSSPFGRSGGEGAVDYHRLFPDEFQDSSLGKIPKGWEVGTLGGLCEKPQYGYTESAKEEPVGPRFLRIKDINKQPWIEWETVPYCEIDPASYEKYRLASGDIVIARIADPGHAAYIEKDVGAVFASYLIRFRVTDPRYGRYIRYWQRTPAYWDLVRGRRSGSTRGNLNAKVLCEFPLLIPPVQVAEHFAESVGPLRVLLQRNLGDSYVLAQTRDTLLPQLLSGALRNPEVEANA